MPFLILFCRFEKYRKKRVDCSGELWKTRIVHNKERPDIMKTELQKKLAKIAPAISIRTIWTPDPDLCDIRQDCCGMEDEDPEDWHAWQSEVRATAFVGGVEVSGSDYLGGTWERAGDVPEESNPTISGYEFQMTREALSQLLPLCQEDEALTAQIESALAVI